MKLLNNMMTAVSSIFLIYVGRDHFVATSFLIIATRTVCFLSECQQKKPTSDAAEISKK